MQRTALIAIVVTVLVGIATSQGCGRAGSSSSSGDGAAYSIRGSITGPSGSQGDMAGFVIVAIERDTGISRTSEIDAGGLFELKNLVAGRPITLVLLTANMRLKSVLSMPANFPNRVRQFFLPQTTFLPRLIMRDRIIQFEHVQGIDIMPNYSIDDTGDGVPNGVAEANLSLHQHFESRNWYNLTDNDYDDEHYDLHEPGMRLNPNAGAARDQDGDGIPNIHDPDIDGDGLVNWIDPDADGNGIFNAFDIDANGDFLNDAVNAQELFQHFPEGVEFIAPQVIKSPKMSGEIEFHMIITAKVRNGFQPRQVRILGPASLFNGSVVIDEDDQGNKVPIAFDFTLLDDGRSNDAAPGDGIYARKVILPANRQPRGYQMIFVQLVFGSGHNQWTMDFPYLFPPITYGSMNLVYNSNTKLVTRGASKPFGNIQDYHWQVVVYRSSDNQAQWTSKELEASDTQVQLDAQEIFVDPEETYTAVAIAYSLDKVPGYRNFVIRSAPIPISP